MTAPRRVTDGDQRKGFGGVRGGHPPAVFFFFSNRLGCLGSLLLSAVLTLVLLLAFDII